MFAHRNIHHFDALTVISPMQHGGEQKDQDCARWYPSAGVACVGDGVTSSPHGADGARLVCDFSPMLFRGDLEERLLVLAEWLVARRLEAQQAPVRLPDSTPASMIPMLEDAVRQQLKYAYQSTLVAVALTPADEATLASVVLCGDSAFFAFSPVGELLLALPNFTAEPNPETDTTAHPDTMRFGPNDELLAKVVGRASDDPRIANGAGIHPSSAERWLICQPIDQDPPLVSDSARQPRNHAMSLTRNDRLLVPQHLIGSSYQRDVGGYVRLRFASLIRRFNVPAIEPKMCGKSMVTAVVPDHVLSGQWLHRLESFPHDTHVVVCTDGFYENFNRPGELWVWLVEHADALLDETQRCRALGDLHAQLHGKSGDDDISFVWIRPADWAPPCLQGFSPQVGR